MPKHFYPSFIIALLSTFIVFLAWSGFQASTQGTQVTDRDYSKGLKYNSTMVEKRAAATMGWSLETKLVEGQLVFQLQNKDGIAITGAQGRLNLYSRPGIDLLTLPLAETSSGRYQTRLPKELTGEITVRVEFEQNGARIQRQLLITI